MDLSNLIKLTAIVLIRYKITTNPFKELISSSVKVSLLKKLIDHISEKDNLTLAAS